MERIELRVSPRRIEVSPRALRRSGRLPGVFYGGGQPALPVEVDAREFMRLGLTSGGAHLIRLVSEHPQLEGNLALIREVQTHPISGLPIHVDLLRVDVNKPVEASVELTFVGKAKGVVEGGILQPLRREIDVRALPDQIPEAIEVDVSELEIHDVLHVSDLQMPPGVEAVYHEDYSIVTVVPPVVEKVAEEEEELAAAEEAAPAAGEEAAAGEETAGEKSEE